MIFPSGARKTNDFWYYSEQLIANTSLQRNEQFNKQYQKKKEKDSNYPLFIGGDISISSSLEPTENARLVNQIMVGPESQESSRLMSRCLTRNHLPISKERG